MKAYAALALNMQTSLDQMDHAPWQNAWVTPAARNAETRRVCNEQISIFFDWGLPMPNHRSNAHDLVTKMTTRPLGRASISGSASTMARAAAGEPLDGPFGDQSMCYARRSTGEESR